MFFEEHPTFLLLHEPKICEQTLQLWITGQHTGHPLITPIWKGGEKERAKAVMKEQPM